MQWSGLKDAPTYDRGTFLKVGKFKLEIVNGLTKQTQSSGEAFIIEFKVLETSDPVNHPVGSKVSWFQKLTDQKVAFGAIKEFLAAVFGYDLSTMKARFEAEVCPNIEAYAAAATDGRNFLAGRQVNVQTEQVTTRKDKEFTRHNWSPVAMVAPTA